MSSLKIPKQGFFVRSKEEENFCPCCSGKVKCIGSRIRKYFDSQGSKNLRIRRLRCEKCNKVHHELPDIIVPYKRYGSKCIESVITDKENEAVPAEESTLLRWKKWFKQTADHFYGCLRSIAISFGKSSLRDFCGRISLLHRLWHYVGDAEGWLARVVRPVVNSNNWVHTRSAFLA